MKYCKYCGKEVEERQICSCPQSMQNIENRKKIIKIAMIAGAAILVTVLAIIVCFACFNGGDRSYSDSSNPAPEDNPISGSKIDPFEYVSAPEITGANGEASFSIYLNKLDLTSELVGPEPNSSDDGEWTQWMYSCSLYSQHVDDLTITYSQNSNLKNGDTVTVKIDVPDSLRDKVKNAEKTYTISDLLDITIFDFFGNIKIEYTGTNGNAEAKIIKTLDSDIMNACIFEITPQYYLSENDEITVSIINAENLKEQYFVVPLDASKTYPVPKLSTYASSADQLPLELIQELAEMYYADRLETLQPDGNFDYKNIEYHGTYFYVFNGTSSGLGAAPYENILKIDVIYEKYLWGTSYGTDHDCLYFTNILVNPDGTVSISYEDHTSYMKSFDEDCYEITSITLENIAIS